MGPRDTAICRRAQIEGWWSVQSLAPRPRIRCLPDPVGPSCATPLPGRNAATGPISGVAGLSVTSETGTLPPSTDPPRITTAHCGMRRATMAVLARYPNNSANRADALGARALLGAARRLGTLVTWGKHHCQEAGMLRATARLRGPTGTPHLADAGPHSGSSGAHLSRSQPASRPSRVARDPVHVTGVPRAIMG